MWICVDNHAPFLYSTIMEKLLKIRVLDNVSGKVYPLLGFTSTGNFDSGPVVSSVTLLETDTMQSHLVTAPALLRRLTLIDNGD